MYTSVVFGLKYGHTKYNRDLQSTPGKTNLKRDNTEQVSNLQLILLNLLSVILCGPEQHKKSTTLSLSTKIFSSFMLRQLRNDLGLGTKYL
jgi:hypothetical protein